MRQQKQVRKCPKCGAALKRNRGPQSHKWYWVCTRLEACYKVLATNAQA